MCAVRRMKPKYSGMSFYPRNWKHLSIKFLPQKLKTFFKRTWVHEPVLLRAPASITVPLSHQSCTFCHKWESSLCTVCIGLESRCTAAGAEVLGDLFEIEVFLHEQRWQPLEDGRWGRFVGRGRRALVGGGHHGCRRVNLFQVQNYLYRTVLDHLY